MSESCGCKVEATKQWLGSDEFGNRYGVDVDKIIYCPLHAATGKLLEAAKEAYSTLSGLESILPRITGDLRQAIAAAERKP